MHILGDKNRIGKLIIFIIIKKDLLSNTKKKQEWMLRYNKKNWNDTGSERFLRHHKQIDLVI